MVGGAEDCSAVPGTANRVSMWKKGKSNASRRNKSNSSSNDNQSKRAQQSTVISHAGGLINNAAVVEAEARKGHNDRTSASGHIPENTVLALRWPSDLRRVGWGDWDGSM